MITWITKELGTSKRSDVDGNNYSIVDVRDLVDREGNPPRLILEKIQYAIKLIKEGKRVVIYCDYGLSRSNTVAVGVLVKHYKYNFEEAVKCVMEKTGKEVMQLGVLESVRGALGLNEKKQKNKKTILITGAFGFIGSALTGVLKEKYKLITPTETEIDLLKGSLGLDLLVRKSGANLIVHLANPKIYNTTRALGEMVVMLKNVLDVCRANGVPIIYPSGWVVFGGYRNKKLIFASEELTPRPKDTYGEAKMICETLLNHYEKSYGLKICLLRLSPVYGLGGDKPKFIWSFFEKAKNNLPIYTHSYKNGLPVLDLINISDAIAAIKAVVEKNFYGTLHIGNGRGFSTFEIAQKIKKICGSKSEISLQKINDYNANIVMDITKAKKILKWSPKTNINNELNKFFSIK
jgi:UDP-glucuronate decarboxylase